MTIGGYAQLIGFASTIRFLFPSSDSIDIAESILNIFFANRNHIDEIPGEVRWNFVRSFGQYRINNSAKTRKTSTYLQNLNSVELSEPLQRASDAHRALQALHSPAFNAH